MREYHARLLVQGRTDQAAAYRSRNAWAWVWVGKGDAPEAVLADARAGAACVDAQPLAQAPDVALQAGGEGVKEGGSGESGIDSPHQPKIIHKDISANHLPNNLAQHGMVDEVARINSFSPQQEQRIREIVASVVSLALKGIRQVDPHGDTPKVEEPVYFKEEKVPVVWPRDGGDVEEVTILGAPPNKGMRLVGKEGDSEVYQMWCDRNLWPMVGWRVAAKPSDDPEKPGLMLVGVYNRSGVRVE